MTQKRFRETAGTPSGAVLLLRRLVFVVVLAVLAGLSFVGGTRIAGHPSLDWLASLFEQPRQGQTVVRMDLPPRPAPAAQRPRTAGLITPAPVAAHQSMAEPAVAPAADPPAEQAPPQDDEPAHDEPPAADTADDVAAMVPDGPPPWQRWAVDMGDTGDRPMIAIVIDDLGLDIAATRRAIALPAPLTLSFLPYSEALDPLTGEARAAGHELMLHLPMEPVNSRIDPGPNALLVDLSAEEIDRRVRWALDRFDGYVGVNNHMGSRFTSTRSVLQPVLQTLADRGLLFIDSRTSTQSVAPEAAESVGIPFARNNVFLDHDAAPAEIQRALALTEQLARRRGFVIAIGHPHEATLSALAGWLPTLDGKGLIAVPVSAIVRTQWHPSALPAPAAERPFVIGLSPA